MHACVDPAQRTLTAPTQRLTILEHRSGALSCSRAAHCPRVPSPYFAEIRAIFKQKRLGRVCAVIAPAVTEMLGGSLTSPSGPQESVLGHGPPGLFRRMRRHRSTTSNKVRTLPALPPYTPWSGNPVTPIARGAARCGFPNNEALSFACRSLSNHEPCGQGGRHVRTCIDVNANTLSGQLSICERPGIRSARISPAMSLAVRSRSHSACI
jgi:hypothetical protein